MDDRNYRLGFSAFPGIGPAKFKKLLNSYGSAKKAWEAPKSELAKLLREKLTVKFEDFRKEFSIEKYIEELEEKNVWFLTLQDKYYPELLSQIKNPPFVLYGKGQVPDGTWFSQSIAIVGARKTTQYGREVTKILTEELAVGGFTIVSGLAIGVDAISHKTAIENNGKTIAVLGCGVDCCYPRENQSIYNSIVEDNGCVVSEFPLEMQPAKWTFPTRNRIIAGLSQAVLVTEGTEDSGSLITANYAIKFGRPVFAVPGPITSSMSKGPYKLIAKGAKLVTSAEDILIELKISSFAKASADKQNSKVKDATRDEQKILEILRDEPLHFDEIILKTGLHSSQIGSILSIMEIKGFIKSLDGGIFSI